MIQRFENTCIYMHSCRLDFDNEYLREFEVKIGTARNVVYRTYAEPIYAKTPENPPRCHVPLIWPHNWRRSWIYYFVKVKNCIRAQKQNPAKVFSDLLWISLYSTYLRHYLTYNFEIKWRFLLDIQDTLCKIGHYGINFVQDI